MLNPRTQPRRYAAHIERQQAARAKALAIGMTAERAAGHMGITTLRAEQLGAKYGFAYQPSRNHQ